MSLCEGGGSGANPGGKASFPHFKRSRRETADSPPRQGGDSRGGTGRDRHFFQIDSLEALTVMQRSFKPRKQGRYLPGEPNPFDVGHGVSVSISPCEGDGTGANPVGQPNFLHDSVAEQRGRRLQPASRRCESCRSLHFHSARHSSNSQDSSLPTREPRGGTGMALQIFPIARVAQQQRQRAEIASSAGAIPAAGTRFPSGA